MDAVEDREVKLQKASAELLAELKTSLPRYLWVSQTKEKRISKESRLIARSIVKISKTNDLIGLLEPFQEWPQLLDPHLHDVLPSLVSAFLYYLCNLREQYFVQRKTGSEVIPLVRGISKILYTLCKIRGTKIVSQFLNNEPRYLDPMHDAFQQWNRTQEADNNLSISSSESMTWEERYIMLIWLSHLMLSPFDLDSVSSLKVNTVADTWAINLPHETPLIARNMVFLCVHHLSFAGKEREASSRLLVRLVLRTDMSKIKLLDCIVGWASSLLQISPNVNPRPIYLYVGVLSFLSGVLHSADKAIVSPYLSIIISCTQAITAQKTIPFKEICSSGLARKFIIKILRSVTLHSLQPHSPLSKSDHFNLAETILEDTVDQLLVFLSDKDTSVRLIASKSLSIIATKAEHMLASEIVEAVVESFDENLLWEGAGTSNQAGKPSRSLKRNLTAIDPLRWHGLVMTLSHLIYRRSPTVKQLPSILNMLIIALGFEQRSSKGGSIGASVRDAACYGIWALARRYTTEELLAVDSSNFNAADHSFQPYSILQILSNEILVAATLDPAGNIRRGASAALQEMIGRHPDKIVEAISLVQIVDYYAISLRSRAMVEIAIVASSLHEAYRNVISDGLQTWRGIRSSDANSRRLAASAMGLIAVSSSQASFDTTISALLHSLSDIQDQQVEERHGLLLSLAAITHETSSNLNSNSDAVFFPALNIIEISEVFRFSCPLSERDFRALPLRPELTSEAACALISAIAVHLSLIGEVVPNYAKPSSLSDKLESFINILGWSLCRAEEIVIDISSKAVHNLMAVLTMEQRNCLVQSWIKRLESKDAKLASGQGKSLGHIAALGACFFSLSESEMVVPLQNLIISTLISQMKPHADVESRVAALRSLSSGILVHRIMTSAIAQAIEACLSDYTTDQRGDIGSLVRIEAISAVGVALQKGILPDLEMKHSLQSKVCRLAVENLDKVRFRAWSCIQSNWSQFYDDQAEMIYFQDLSSISTDDYYKHVLSLWPIGWLRKSLLEGYVSSASAGSESVLRSSRAALVAHVESFTLNDLVQFCNGLKIVIQTHLSDDRVLVPALETMAFLLETGLLSSLQNEEFCWTSILDLVQRSHYKSGNLHKLVAAVKIYTGLAMNDFVRREVLAKLCSMLCHPFPLIRNMVAEGLFQITDLSELKAIRFSDQPTVIKTKTRTFRQRLQIENT